MFGATIVIALAIPIGQVAKQPADDPKDAPQVVAKGKDFIVHALRDKRDEIQQGGFMREPNDGFMLLHTTISSGKMVVLARGSRTERKGPPMGRDNDVFHDTKVLDFRVDKERLYILNRVESKTFGLPSVTYGLHVFYLESGEQILNATVSRSKDADDKKTEKGPLRLRDNGVEVFGTAFEFNGTEPLKQPPAKKKE
jgi:hypothetical protein